VVGDSPRATTAGLERAARTLAFLFTDIEGSTRLWERHPDAMRSALAQHDRILRTAVEGEGGRVVKTTGDGIMAVFGTARDGLAASLTAQLALRDEAWGPAGPLRVRMGMHVGEAEVEGEGDEQDFHGQSVNRAARIMAAGHGGQVLLSAAAAALVLDRLPESASLRDLGEHHLKDLNRPEHVYELVHPGLPETGRPLETADAAVSTLPAEPSTFVGRDEERARVVASLTDGPTRLLTLTGPGGIGKTRLALRAARDMASHFRAGAIFVDLSATRDTSSVLVAISRELGLADASERSQLDELTAAIGQRHLLIVLDNFEQVTASAPTISGLLAACPELAVLVTSREALHVRGERLIPVPPLALPDTTRKAISAEQIADFEAVRLFVDRAQAIQPDFVVTDENAAILADICARLEGVPLAIELATARLRVFSLATLRDRLDSQLWVLSSGARDLPERQRTLRATIEWSFQLLEHGEQRLFEVLACFSGAAVEGIEAVAGALAGWLADVDPVDGLVSLVDKSLVRRIDDGPEPRFTMLGSVREFASERLEADPELARRARSAHADYYGRWVASHAAELTGPDRPAAMDRLEAEVENLKLAWRCSVAERDLDRLQSLIGGLRPLYDARGWYRGLIGLVDDMLTTLDQLPPSVDLPVLAATLRSNQARALSAMEGYTDEVQAAYERLLNSLQGADVPQVYPVLRGLASLHTFRMENGKAVELGRQILDLADQERDVSMRVAGHMIVGSALSFMGRVQDGLPDLETGAGLFESERGSGDWFRLGPDPRVACLTALSLLRWWDGTIETSMRRSAEAVALSRSGAHPSTIGYALHHASLLRLMRGEPEEAREHAVQVIEVATEHDLHIWRAVGTVILGATTVALGRADEGLRWVREGLDRYRGLRTPPVFWPFLLHVTANACAQAGETDLGLAAVDEALSLVPQMADLHLAKGDLLLRADPGLAEAEFEQAWAAAQAWGAATSALRAAIRLCRMSGGSSRDVAKARRARLDEVLRTFTEGSEYRDLVEARELLRA
jgi:predicted ATPase/class 3 adenylate cyclase